MKFPVCSRNHTAGPNISYRFKNAIKKDDNISVLKVEGHTEMDVNCVLCIKSQCIQ